MSLVDASPGTMSARKKTNRKNSSAATFWRNSDHNPAWVCPALIASAMYGTLKARLKRSEQGMRSVLMSLMSLNPSAMSTTYMPYGQRRRGGHGEERGDEGAAEDVEEGAAERSGSAEGGGESIVKGSSAESPDYDFHTGRDGCLATMRGDLRGEVAAGYVAVTTAGHRGKGSQWGDAEGMGVGGRTREETQWCRIVAELIPLFRYFRIPNFLSVISGDRVRIPAVHGNYSEGIRS
ncbi:hypothetical protein DFH07DRAFT_764776 [Mycena maculata]|uniref:Uncharacterized protein n=1 Tax=Mycena maculata TaxID=230809 RepID=A0AAD7NZQ3_9AGAR|nr:hypothetical protein DFH07DRAFT_764776 [Mycena maculata]